MNQSFIMKNTGFPTKDDTLRDECTEYVSSVFLHSGLNHLVNQNNQLNAETENQSLNIYMF